VATNGRAVADFDLTLKGGGILEFNTVGFRKGGPLTVFSPLDFLGSLRRDEDG